MTEIDIDAEPSDTAVAARLRAIGDAMINSPKFRALVAASRALDARAGYLRTKLGQRHRPNSGAQTQEGHNDR
jgi:hypothetical protein